VAAVGGVGVHWEGVEGGGGGCSGGGGGGRWGEGSEGMQKGKTLGWFDEMRYNGPGPS